MNLDFFEQKFEHLKRAKFGDISSALYNLEMSSFSYPELLVFINKCLKIESNIYFYKFRGEIKYELKDFVGSIKDLSFYLKSNPDDINSYSVRGDCKIELGDYRGAINDINKVIKFGGFEGNYCKLRAFCKEILGDYQGALDDYIVALDSFINWYEYDISIDMDKEKSLFYLKFANLKNILGDKVGACLDWSKAGELGAEDTYEKIRKYCNR